MHICPNCQSDCDCDRGLPGCEHLCVGKTVEFQSRYVINPIDDRMIMGGGMMLRDYFAAAALPLVAGRNNTSASVAKSVYAIADAMLAERDK